GIGAAVSFDGGKKWQTASIPGLTLCAGGPRQRAGDSWLSFAPNGDLYHSTVIVDLQGTAKGFAFTPNSIVVTKSTDGGLTWGPPTTLIEDTDPTFFNDKDAITADPTDARFAYAVWERRENGFKGPAMLARTTDGGQSWEPARPIFDPGGNDFTIG